MQLPRSILTAVDFGEPSGRAVAAAGMIAERCRSGLTLLHAETMEAPAYFTSEQVDALERQRHALQVQAEQFLARFGRQHTSARFTASVDGRTPVEAIVRASEEADLVVMGTHGRHGVKRWWLGSVAEAVLRQITRPLLIVRGAGAPVEAMLDRSLVYVAPTETTSSALSYARVLADCFDGHVDAVEGAIEPAVRRTDATIVIIHAPHPRTTAWLSAYGEPLLQFCTVPVLFVPEITQGVSS